MLYFEWKEEDALKYAKEEGYEDGFDDGRAEERKEMIRALNGVLSPEKIAETFHVAKEYVLDVLKDDGTMYACQPEHPYNKK